jgi:methionyl-tRNA formyltransferase
VKPDRGDIVAQRVVPIDEEDTALTLFRKLTGAAAAMMRDTYPLLRAGRAPRIPQDHARASYFGGRRPEDGRIAWSQDTAAIRNLVRAVTHPYPGAFALWRDRKLLIWQTQRVDGSAAHVPPGTVLAVDDGVAVQTGDGALGITLAQIEGDAERPAGECARRHGITQGVMLS